MPAPIQFQPGDNEPVRLEKLRRLTQLVDQLTNQLAAAQKQIIALQNQDFSGDIDGGSP